MMHLAKNSYDMIAVAMNDDPVLPAYTFMWWFRIAYFLEGAMMRHDL